MIAVADVLEIIDTKKLSDNTQFTKDGKNVILCRKEHTCAYLFGEREQLQPIVEDLPMYQ